MTLVWLPAAKNDQKGRTLSWATRRNPKGVLHTTETSGWPSYQGWTVNPHATVMPHPGKGVEIHGHVPFTSASFSLRNTAGGVETNREFAFQFELIGTCDPRGPGYFWPGADVAVLLDLYDKLIKPLSDSFGIPLKTPAFQAYPASAGFHKPSGPSNTVRMSGSAWEDFTGWCGHQHVPENVHGDPGAFPWDRMMAAVQQREDDMPLNGPDKAWIAETISAKAETAAETALEKVLKDRAIVPNKKVDPNDPTEKQASPWTFVGVLAAADQKTDQQGRVLAAHSQILSDHTKALATQNALLQEILKRLPVPPA